MSGPASFDSSSRRRLSGQRDLAVEEELLVFWLRHGLKLKVSGGVTVFGVLPDAVGCCRLCFIKVVDLLL